MAARVTRVLVASLLELDQVHSQRTKKKKKTESTSSAHRISRKEGSSDSGRSLGEHGPSKSANYQRKSLTVR